MRLRWRRPATPRPAFRYLAEDAPSGYGDAADRLVRAVRAAGVPVEYRGWSSGRPDELPLGVNPHSRDPRPADRAPRRAPVVAHVIPENLEQIRPRFKRQTLISHTVWETDLLPRHWPEILNTTDRVIVPTEWNRDVFVKSGVAAPVVVVPHVVCDPVPGDGGISLGLPDGVVCFYTIGRWDQRKNPAAVVRAFLDAFTADDPVALVVKTSPFTQYPLPGEWGSETKIKGTTMLELARIIREHPRPPMIRAEIEDWSPSRIAGLHTRGDCYVALTHGEGWGLGAFDAAAYGNPVVMTGWGGQLTFLEPEHSFLVDHDVMPVDHWEPHSYAPEQHWAIPSHEHAVEQLRAVAADLGSARRRAAPLRDKVLREFAPARVAATLFDVVPELAEVVGDLAPAPVAEPARDRLRAPTRAGGVRLVGLCVGRWRSQFDNWLEMAQRYGYEHELIGEELAEPYLAHATKWRLTLDYFSSLPRDRVVFYLDSTDGFVCDTPDAALERYRSYGAPLVLSAQYLDTAPADDPEQRWSIGNAGAYIGEAGVIADALRDGFDRADWGEFGRVSDQHAMLLHFQDRANRHLLAIDFRRSITQNIAASPLAEEYEEHRTARERSASPSTSSVHFFGDNGHDYNAFARLYGLTPAVLEESGRFQVAVPDDTEPSNEPVVVRTGELERIPRIAHYVFGLRPEPEPFHLVHYLAIRSCLEMVQPDEVRLHCHHLPFGRYWDRLADDVLIDHVEPVRAVSEKRYEDLDVARYAYAHHADFVRLDALAKHGGIYADLDTLFVTRLPGRLWRAPCVIGREADVPLPGQTVPRPALSNAVMMSMPNSKFIEAWRSEIGDALDGTWANHSCFLANDLAARLPDDVHVEPQRTFHAFEPTREGIALLLERAAPDLDGIVGIHLMAHLWWDEDRRDFSDVHAERIDEAWVRTTESTYARAARRFLPAS